MKTKMYSMSAVFSLIQVINAQLNDSTKKKRFKNELPCADFKWPSLAVNFLYPMVRLKHFMTFSQCGPQFTPPRIIFHASSHWFTKYLKVILTRVCYDFSPIHIPPLVVDRANVPSTRGGVKSRRNVSSTRVCVSSAHHHRGGVSTTRGGGTFYVTVPSK